METARAASDAASEMWLQVVLSLLLLTDSLIQGQSPPHGLHPLFMTRKIQIYTGPAKHGGMGSPSAPVMNHKNDRDTLRRLRNILMSLLEGLPESKKPYPGKMATLSRVYMGSPPVSMLRRPIDWAIAREIDEDVSELMNIKGEDREAQTKGGTGDNEILQSLEEISNEIGSPPSTNFTTGERYTNASRNSDKSLDKSIQMEENAARMMNKDIAMLKRSQRRLKGRETTSENDILQSLERINKEVEYAPATAPPETTPFKNIVTDAEALEQKAEKMMARSIANVKSAQKHLGPSDDLQQFGQLMRYLDKYIPDLNTYLRMDSDVGATERAFALLAILKNFLCLGREVQSQNSQEYFKTLLEDEMHILRVLLDDTD